MASFVALQAIGGNMQSEITNQASALGGDFLIVPEDLCPYNQIAIITGDAMPEFLAFSAFESVREIEGIEVIPLLTRRMLIYNPNAGVEQPVTVSGILPSETLVFRGWEIDEGEFFESENQANAIIIGRGIANRYRLDIGDELEVRPGEVFNVIGILANTNSNDDTTVHMPLYHAQRIFDREGSITYMTAKFSDVDYMADFEWFAREILLVTNNVRVLTNEQLLERVLGILGSVNITLQMVAGVALIAAGFGIINTMMTAVYERRREIGILQAIGGKSTSIFGIFVIESGLYGLLGGLLGVLAGYLTSIIAAPIVSENSADMLMGMEMGSNIDARLIVITVAFSLVISVCAGLYPAWKASRLTPVEAITAQ